MIDNSTGIWLDNDQTHWFDPDLATALGRFFMQNGNSVVDLGCGRGEYVQSLREIGLECKGYDGNPQTPALSDGLGEVLDLSIPVTLPRFDWVLSLEVGEHIPRHNEGVFIRNLYKHCRSGIVLSWAVPDQGGEGHFNERSNSYVKQLFSTLGFYNDLENERILRNAASLKWFKDTLMVFWRA